MAKKSERRAAVEWGAELQASLEAAGLCSVVVSTGRFGAVEICGGDLVACERTACGRIFQCGKCGQRTVNAGVA